MKISTIIAKQIAILFFILTSSNYADSLKIINKNDELVDIEFYKPINSPLFGDISKQNFTLSQIDSMFVSADYMKRAMAAALAANGKVADTVKCVELLVDALAGELSNPFSDKMASEVSSTITEFLLEQYLYDFRVLLYKKGSGLIKPYFQKSSGDLKTCLILVAGLLGDKDVRDDIRNIYLESDSGFMRSQAIRVMNIFPDINDIPILKKALKDEYYRVDKNGNEIRFIQGNARGALLKLGFEPEEIEEMRMGKE